jgi:hypothetical protein
VQVSIGKTLATGNLHAIFAGRIDANKLGVFGVQSGYG